MFNILIKSSLNFNAVFVKDLACSSPKLSLIHYKNRKESLNQGGYYGALLIELAKAFDRMMHDLLIMKLQTYGFDNDFLNFICSYLLGRKQRTKIKLSFSTWLNIEHGVLQGSTLGPLLFNINTLDMFFEQQDVNFATYADDNTPYFLIKTMKYFSVSFIYVH